MDKQISAGSSSPAGGRGYYDYPVVRRPVWTWEVPVYFWLGGIAGGAYLTASAAGLFGDADDRRSTGSGFYVAAAAALPCAPLLIADLGRPERFHHTLRIFKPLSPMNLGVWTLASFTPVAVGRAVAQAGTDNRLPALLSSLTKLIPRGVLDVAGSVLGLALAGYTGVLLAATNVPLWAKSKLLSAVFTASGVSAGAASVSYAAGRRASRRTLKKLETIETTGTLAELGLIAGFIAQSGRAAKPMREAPYAAPFWLGAVGLGNLVPLLLRGAGRLGSDRTARRLGNLAALCTIAGSLALRWTIFDAGKASSQDQAASLEFSS
ncbi:MAG TPA: NrfD/PsrC family molybdoenzyme membrane anchor subunit [Candidatus Acidoferrum sp.]|nr:NrfD/PsrC family molybdoenzyme membrane anchor subunit [Candidatus Acidoferrum sp.]